MTRRVDLLACGLVALLASTVGCSSSNTLGADAGSGAGGGGGSAGVAGASDGSSGAPTSWPTYGGGIERTFSRPTSMITAANAASLVDAWTFHTSDAVSASPAVVDGVVYVGAWDGVFYALDAATGGVKWKFVVDCQPNILPIPLACQGDAGEPDRSETDGGIITSSATVQNGRVWFAAGKTVYCLDARTGALVYKTVICGKPEEPDCERDPNDRTNIFSSPAVVDGMVVIGSSVDGEDGYRGGIMALDAQSGAVKWRFEVDPVLDANGQPVLGPEGLPAQGQNRGCGNVWSSAAIDPDAHLAFFGTSDCHESGALPYHEAVLALDIATGKLRWVFQPVQDNGCDFDFGATANVFDVGGKRYVGVGAKNGTYYVVEATTGKLLWSTKVVFGGLAGGFIGSSAYDGKRIYGATALGDMASPVCDPTDPTDTMTQDPSLHAFDVTNGTVAWQASKAYSFGSTTVANGVVFVGTGNLVAPALLVYDAESGKLLKTFPLQGAMNSSAVMVGNMVFFGSGNSYDGAGGGVHALRLP